MQDHRCDSCHTWLVEVRRWEQGVLDARLLKCPKCGWKYVECEKYGIIRVIPPPDYPKDKR